MILFLAEEHHKELDSEPVARRYVTMSLGRDVVAKVFTTSCCVCSKTRNPNPRVHLQLFPKDGRHKRVVEHPWCRVSVCCGSRTGVKIRSKIVGNGLLQVALQIQLFST